jgi:hypothetical protein
VFDTAEMKNRMADNRNVFMMSLWCKYAEP